MLHKDLFSIEVCIDCVWLAMQGSDDPVTDYCHCYSNVKAIQKLNETELKLGVGSKKSWHHMYSDSAYIFVG